MELWNVLAVKVHSTYYRINVSYLSWLLTLECDCDKDGIVSISECSDGQECKCIPSRTGIRCDECAPGFSQFPDCIAGINFHYYCIQ